MKIKGGDAMNEDLKQQLAKIRNEIPKRRRKRLIKREVITQSVIETVRISPNIKRKRLKIATKTS